jgi:hypothetical protein
MEWNVTKVVVGVLALMIFAVLMTFCSQFDDILEMDKVMQGQRDTRMYNDMMESIPAMTVVVAAHATGGTKNGM